MMVLNEDKRLELDATIVRRLLNAMADADRARAAADEVLGATQGNYVASVAPSEGARRSHRTWTRAS